MGDVSLNRPINAEPAAGGIAKSNRILDTMSPGWTDERHMMYISSMEASFVDQLYNHHAHNANGEGFKVHRGGVWEYIKYEKKTNSCAQSRKKYCLPANPWIQHFRQRNCGSNAQSDGLEVSEGDHESGTQTNRVRLSVSHGREWEACKGEKQLLDESTEVSDQNFADDEVEVEAESSKACKRRRLSSSISRYRDE
ncbi:cold-regulated protein 27-like [Phragmites australis]|uniref:cold-regulated protein 27-like n=1 Tax=Phragmites australis TaxID=29695 RepID=UPI002D77CEFD|nr:cold-regulated protein 27-like [Phragmites australis]